MFAVVHFVEDNTVEVVPMLWLVKSGNVSYLLNFAPCVCVCVCLTSQQKLYGQMEMRLLLSIIQKTLEAGTLIPDLLGHLGEQLIDYINVSPQWSM